MLEGRAPQLFAVPALLFFVPSARRDDWPLRRTRRWLVPGMAIIWMDFLCSFPCLPSKCGEIIFSGVETAVPGRKEICIQAGIRIAILVVAALFTLSAPCHAAQCRRSLSPTAALCPRWPSRGS